MTLQFLGYVGDRLCVMRIAWAQLCSCDASTIQTAHVFVPSFSQLYVRCVGLWAPGRLFSPRPNVSAASPVPEATPQTPRRPASWLDCR